MCDACVNLMRSTMATLTDDQQKAVDAYVAHEIEMGKEEMSEEQKNLEEQIDNASALLIELRLLLAEKPLDVNTEINELMQHITNYHLAIEKIDEIAPYLERTV